MKIIQTISCVILWILNIIEIIQIIKSRKLLKMQRSGLEDLEDLYRRYSQVCDEVNEEKQKYKEAKERLLEKCLPDFEDTSEDDTSPQKDGEPEFLYSHKNGEIIIRAARCDLEWLAIEIGYVAHRLYCGLYSKDPAAADEFRDYITIAIAGDDSPTWDTSAANVENMFIIPGETADEASDEE